MKRSAVVAVIGAAATLAGATWYALVDLDVATDLRVGGIALERVALGVVAVGAALLFGGLLVTWKRGRDDTAMDDVDADADADEPLHSWPTIVVRSHGRPRHQAARVVLLPPPVRAAPSPWHPSVADSAARTPPSIPVALGDGWLPDNVQRLPTRL